MVVSKGKTISKTITIFKTIYTSLPFSVFQKLRYTFPIDLFPSKLLQTVASTLKPLTTGFLVILVDSLEGVHLAKHSPTSFKPKIRDTTTRRCQQKIRL